MQCGCILCQRALHTLRKCKATQARTISKDSKLSWSSPTSLRHANSHYFTRAHLLIRGLRWEIGFRQFSFPSFNIHENRAGGAQRHHTGYHTRRQQLLLQRDFFQPEQQHLVITQRHPNPHSGYSDLQLNSYVIVTVTKVYPSHCNNPNIVWFLIGH